MKKFGIILFGLGMLLAQPVAAQQTAPSYAPDVPNQTLFEYEFRKGSGVRGDWEEWAPQVGPYLGRVGWDNPTGPLFTLYSVDFVNSIYSGLDVNAMVSNIGVGDMSMTLLGAGSGASTYGTPLQRYQSAAWLASQYFTAGTSSWSSIQAAIWTIMTPTFPVSSTFANPWLSTVIASGFVPTGIDFDRWSVLTAMDDTGQRLIGRQEMLMQGPVLRTVGEVPPTVTPEPQTYVLLFSGLIFLVVFGRRRLKEMGYA